MDEKKLIIDPQSGDTVRADEIIEDLQAVLVKHGYALVHKPNAIILAKIEGFKKLRVIAEVKEVSIYGAVYQVKDWTPKPGRTQ